MASNSSSRKAREPNQIKRAKKGHQSQRGVPEIYEEVKKTFSFALTPTAKASLQFLAKHYRLSMSEFLEQIGRGQIVVRKAEEINLMKQIVEKARRIEAQNYNLANNVNKVDELRH